MYLKNNEYIQKRRSLLKISIFFLESMKQPSVAEITSKMVSDSEHFAG